MLLPGRMKMKPIKIFIFALILVFVPSFADAEEGTIIESSPSSTEEVIIEEIPVPTDTTTSSTESIDNDQAGTDTQTDLDSTSSSTVSKKLSSDAEIASTTSSTSPDITISVRIEGPNTTLLTSSSVNVPESCEIIGVNETASTTISGYRAVCALQTLAERGAITYTMTHWSFGFSLDQINEVVNAADWSSTWILRLNNTTAMLGIADLEVAANDALLLSFGSWPMNPLTVAASTTTIEIGEEIMFEARAYDEAGNLASWNSTTTFYIDSTATTSPSSTLLWTAQASSSTVSVWADAANMTRSELIFLSITSSTVSSSTTPSSPAPTENQDSQNNDNPGNSCGACGSNPIVTPEITPSTTLVSVTSTVDAILAYLKSQQDQTGKISDGATTDWVIMSMGADDEYAEDIKNSGLSLLEYAKSYIVTSTTELNVCAGYPRHTLALLAAGVPETDSLLVDLKAKMQSTDCYTNHLYGQNGINDDIFALFSFNIGHTSERTNYYRYYDHDSPRPNRIRRLYPPDTRG